MDIKPGSKVEAMVGLLEENKKRLREKAHEFPVSRESYLELPLEERMQEAKRVLSRFANVGKMKGISFSPPEAATTTQVETDSSHHVVTGYAGYAGSSWRNGPNATCIDKHPSIVVWAKVTDTTDAIDSRTEWLGEIEFHYKENREGETVGTSLEGNTGTGHYVPIDSSEMEDVIEIIDGSVGDLIDTTVAMHRNLGTVAIAETV
jgi:hypothetical protein